MLGNEHKRNRERAYQQVLHRHGSNGVVGDGANAELSAASRADGGVLHVQIGNLGEELLHLAINHLPGSTYRVADISKVLLADLHIRSSNVVASADSVVVGVDLTLAVRSKHAATRVSVGISPNGEPLVGEGPVQGIVLSGSLTREILFMSTANAKTSNLPPNQSC